MDAWNWDTREAWLWLNNDEYAWKASWRLASDLTRLDREARAGLRMIFGEVYCIDLPDGEGVNYDRVDWGDILRRFREDVAEDRAYRERQEAAG